MDPVTYRVPIGLGDIVTRKKRSPDRAAGLSALLPLHDVISVVLSRPALSRLLLASDT
jgi:hypothetical protein